jgi:hypothetical protein
MRGGKRQFGGKVAYAGSIRNRLALLCAHGALACFLVYRFTINAAPFPNSTKRDIWLHTPLWPGNNPTESISYSQHVDGLKYYLNKAGILIRKVRCPAGATARGRATAPLLGCSPCGHAARCTAAACTHPVACRAASPPKVTHAFRMFKARDLDEQGVDESVGPLCPAGFPEGASASALAAPWPRAPPTCSHARQRPHICACGACTIALKPNTPPHAQQRPHVSAPRGIAPKPSTPSHARRRRHVCAGGPCTIAPKPSTRPHAQQSPHVCAGGPCTIAPKPSTAPHARQRRNVCVGAPRGVAS